LLRKTLVWRKSVVFASVGQIDTGHPNWVSCFL
jgi:hypothetical protein